MTNCDRAPKVIAKEPETPLLAGTPLPPFYIFKTLQVIL
jgi:hypothetical protein